MKIGIVYSDVPARRSGQLGVGSATLFSFAEFDPRGPSLIHSGTQIRVYNASHKAIPQGSIVTIGGFTDPNGDEIEVIMSAFGSL